ncbi:hypothetical protein ACFWR9_35485 [Streptomyces sp. NPDC058534]|uniref:hypothetical protein n=1 Tax=Streptomyces sp. NPDC058534 TaxID=3346541 RepID=UPI0036527706
MATRRAVIMAAGAGTLASSVSTSASGAPRAAGSDVLVVVEKSGHAVAFYETTSGRSPQRVQLPDYPHEMVVDSRRRLAYVGHYGVRMSATVGEGGAAVLVIDLAERTLARTVEVPHWFVHGQDAAAPSGTPTSHPRPDRRACSHRRLSRSKPGESSESCETSSVVYS